MAAVLGIIGAGGHARVVHDVATSMQHFERIFGLDQRYPDVNHVGLIDMLGSDQDLHLFAQYGACAVVAIGDNAVRTRLFNRLVNANVPIASALLSTSAYVSPTASCGQGSVVGPKAVLGAGARVCCNVIINSGAIIEHDVIVAEHCHVAPGAVLCGGVLLESGVLVGAGAVVLPNLKIGCGAVIGAGAVVTRSVKANNVVAGVPGRLLKYTDQ